MVTRADLHVHSRYSDRPSEWILRRIGAPECFTKPRTVYDTARRRGMQFVTISDHNCINGALDIAHLPGAFVSNEITTYFPEDGCKVHVLCWDITPVQFEEIERLRPNILELRDYMHTERIVHACAHPLYAVNDRLTLEHFEKLLVLFNVFETMNGGRNRRGNDLVASIVNSLSRHEFERLADRHSIAPVGDEPWIKGTTGGSDDHSGAFIAKGFTECPAASTPKEFLQHVVERRSRPGGLDGTPLSFAHSLYSIGYQYYRDTFLASSPGTGDLALRMMEGMFGKQQTQVRFKDRVAYIAGRFTGRSDRQVREEIEFKRMVSTEMSQLFGEDWLRDDFATNPTRYHDLNQRTFELASRVSNELFFQFSRKFVSKLQSGSIFGSLEALSAVGPILLGVAPYLFSFAHQNRDTAFLREVSHRFLGTPSEPKPKTAVFVDSTSLEDPAGVLAGFDRLPESFSQDRTIIAFGKPLPGLNGRVRYFMPVGHLPLPDYERQLAFPPALDLLDFCDREQFTSLVVATPSLGGLAMIAAGKLLNIRTFGLYHTELPAVIRQATGDEDMEGMAWRYVRWFYEQTDVLYVPSEAAARRLALKGFDRAKMLDLAPAPERPHPLVQAG